MSTFIVYTEEHADARGRTVAGDAQRHEARTPNDVHRVAELAADLARSTNRVVSVVRDDGAHPFTAIHPSKDGSLRIQSDATDDEAKAFNTAAAGRGSLRDWIRSQLLGG